MKKVSVKNLSLLGLILTAASAVTAAVVPDKADGKRLNNGTLRAFSATNAGVDQDAAAAVISCLALSGAASCTVTVQSNTTTGFFANESRLLDGGFYYQTIGNTSQTGGPANGNQSSVLQIIS
jgi:hypothetical protein